MTSEVSGEGCVSKMKNTLLHFLNHLLKKYDFTPSIELNCIILKNAKEAGEGLRGGLASESVLHSNVYHDVPNTQIYVSIRLG